MQCKICTHAHRAEMEEAILGRSELDLRSIADEFSVTQADLKFHILMHMPQVDLSKGEGAKPTIARKLKLKEADMLLAVVEEYMGTLQVVGNQIQTLSESEGMLFTKMLGKPVVDLYIGVGGEIRATVKTLAELNGILNGPENVASNGLHALAAAITRSAAPSDPSANDE